LYDSQWFKTSSQQQNINMIHFFCGKRKQIKSSNITQLSLEMRNTIAFPSRAFQEKTNKKRKKEREGNLYFLAGSSD